jgi:alpha-glucosidase
MLRLTRALLELRRREPALSIGDFALLAVEDAVLAYTRTWRGRRLTVALNLQSAPRTIRGTELAGRIALSTRPGRAGEPIDDRFELAGDEAVVVIPENELGRRAD